MENSHFKPETEFDKVLEAYDQNTASTLETKLRKYLINDNTMIRPITPIIEIDNAIFATKGDFSVVGGQPKAGKTSIAVQMIATAFMPDVRGIDTLKIRTKFCEGMPVVYIDTEQPKAYTNKLRKKVLKLLNMEKQPENLIIANLRELSSREKQEALKGFFQMFSDAHLWIIDGVADLIHDPNDTREAFSIVEYLMVQSEKLDTTIVGYIHENPGASGKLRGNLGSEAERKCGGAITVKKIKDKGCHCIESKILRGSADFEPIYMCYDPVLERMVLLDEQASQEMKQAVDKGAIKKQKRVELAKRCLATGGLTYSKLVEAIQSGIQEVEGKSVGKRTCESRLQELVHLGIIAANSDYYQLTEAYIPQP